MKKLIIYFQLEKLRFFELKKIGEMEKMRKLFILSSKNIGEMEKMRNFSNF